MDPSTISLSSQSVASLRKAHLISLRQLKLLLSHVSVMVALHRPFTYRTTSTSRASYRLSKLPTRLYCKYLDSAPPTSHPHVPIAITLSPPGRRVVQPGVNTRQRRLDSARPFTSNAGAQRYLMGRGEGQERRGAQISILFDAE
jgi:hypothetical protein